MTPQPEPTVADLLRSGRATYSFEFFPPKTPEDSDKLWQTLDHLQPLAPDFVSVTYGANGSNRDRTLAITERLARESSLRTVGHLTCASQSRAELVAAIEAYRDAGVHHVLAIRGDMPGGPTEPWVRHPDGLANATELVRLVRETGVSCIGVAAFPDPHPQVGDPALDARLLVERLRRALSSRSPSCSSARSPTSPSWSVFARSAATSRSSRASCRSPRSDRSSGSPSSPVRSYPPRSSHA